MDNTAANIITVCASKFGKGVFAKKDISKGSSIIKIRGRKITFSDSLEFGNRESYCLQVGIDKYIIPDAPFIYCNHSCDPNAGIKNNLDLVAIKPISSGEEVRWDYSTSMLERHWTMHCRCGSPICRQLINDFDLLPRHIQQLYLNLDIVLPFIMNYVRGSSCISALMDAK